MPPAEDSFFAARDAAAPELRPPHAFRRGAFLMPAFFAHATLLPDAIFDSPLIFMSAIHAACPMPDAAAMLLAAAAAQPLMPPPCRVAAFFQRH